MFNYDFAPLFRSSVGFDALVDLLETATSLTPAGDGYPPYKIERRGEDAYRITLNVTGFAPDELSIETKENWLVVAGKKAAEDGRRYLWQGITPQSFERRFQLADFVKATGATLADGLLTIDLVREVPEAPKPRRIEIGAGKPTLIDKAKKLVERAAYSRHLPGPSAASSGSARSASVDFPPRGWRRAAASISMGARRWRPKSRRDGRKR